MALRDIVVETDSVVYCGQTIPLRGINTNDIKAVLVRNRLSADMLFNIAERKGIKSAEDLTEDAIKDIANSAIVELPVLIATIIAQSADDVESYEIVQSLPAPVQFDCLRKIARMTFTDATNFGQFLGNVTAAVAAMGTLLPQTRRNDGVHQPSVGSLQ